MKFFWLNFEFLTTYEQFCMHYSLNSAPCSYMFRHAFEHEHQDCNLPYIFSESDKSFIESDLNENLLAQKDTIIHAVSVYKERLKKLTGLRS